MYDIEDSDIAISRFHDAIHWLMLGFINYLPEDIRIKYINYWYPKMFFVQYGGEWLRLNDEKVPEWLEKKVWKKVFRSS